MTDWVEGRHSGLLLPEIEEDGNLGTRVAKRAVSLTLISIVCLGGVGMFSLFFIHLDVALDAVGILEPRTVHAIRSPVGGVVNEMLVTTGEEVAEGQIVARLDAFGLQTELTQLRLEADLKRNRPDTVRRDFQLLEQQIEIIEKQLDRRILRSPGVGTVLSEELEDLIGARVAEGELVLEVGSADAWQGALLVAEQDIHLIKVGDPVKFEVRAIATLDQWRNELFRGQVIHVGTDVIADQEGYYRVIAELDAEDLDPGVRERFRRGMSTQARIITRSARAIDHLVRFLEDKVDG